MSRHIASSSHPIPSRRRSSPLGESIRRIPSFGRRGVGVATPFLGRAGELAAIGEAARGARLLVVTGAEGAGKSRLAAELLTDPRRLAASRAARVRVGADDRWSTVAARAERQLGIRPAGLGDALAAQPIALVVDDVHRLGEAGRQAARLVAGRGPGRLVVLSRDAFPAVAGSVARADFALEGLDEASADALWSHLDDVGPSVGRAAFERAMARSRGNPGGIRKEHARAAYGETAWHVGALPAEARRALECLAVLRHPATLAAVAALDPDIGVEAALAELLARHLVEPALTAAGGAGAEPDGRLALTGSVRDEVLASIDGGRRRALERAAAEHLAAAPADGSLLEPVDRLCAIARHRLAAGDLDGAAEIVAAWWRRALARGGAADVEALALDIEARSLEVRGARDPALAAVRAGIAERQGRVAEALELFAWCGGASSPDPVRRARLVARSGDVDAAADMLASLVDSDEADTRGRAAAALAEICLLRGDPDAARRGAGEAFQRDRATLGARARAELHRVLAAVEERAGRWASARANLSRAASAAEGDPVEAARVDLARARCLALEGRRREAAEALDGAAVAAAEHGAAGLASDVQLAMAALAAIRGERAEAARILRAQLTARRALGDELGALDVEVSLAEVSLARSDLASAREHAGACATAAASRGLRALAVRADLVLAGADVDALSLDVVRPTLAELASQKIDPSVAAGARRLLALAAARGNDAVLEGANVQPGDGPEDELEATLAQTHIALAGEDKDAAWDAAKQALLAAERLQRGDEATEVAAILAWLSFARGDRDRAASRAHRALARARERGLPRAHAVALLVSSALARDAGDLHEATRLAGRAASIAGEAGLTAMAIATARAVDVLGGGEGTAAVDGEARAAAVAFADGLLADLGLTLERPYRVVLASGEGRRVADASPEWLERHSRSLVVDAVSEVVWRGGRQVAELRRRSLLKRLLYLFSRCPGRVFSKEEIVESVWEVEYHPLRHDAALFTNIMRMRRLLGEDGAELLRVTDAGYALTPPGDFLYVEPASA